MLMTFCLIVQPDWSQISEALGLSLI